MGWTRGDAADNRSRNTRSTPIVARREKTEVHLDLNIDAMRAHQARELERIVEEGRQRAALEDPAPTRTGLPITRGASPQASTPDPIPVLARLWRGWSRPRREPACTEAAV